MTELTTFNYLSNNVRVIEIDSQPLFSVADVCGVLKHSNSREALSRHVDPSQVRNVMKRDVRDPSFPNRGMTFVTEAGVYDLVFGSKLPQAQEFKHWVTREVLPAIRKDGAYIKGEELVKTGELDEEEFVLRAMEILQRKVRVRLDSQIRAASAALHIA